MKSALSKSAFTALRWNYLGFVVRSGSNFVIGIFLARLLGPKPFGQLAAAALVLGIANLLADAGFTTALVQTPDLNDIEIRFVFTVQFLIAALLTLLCMASSGIMATTFHDPAIRNVVLGMAPVFLLQAIGQTASALLRRKMDFKSIQTAQVSSYLAGYLLIGVPLANLGAGVWSLVAAQLSQSLIFSVQLYWSVRHSIVPTLDRSGLRLLRFGSKVTLANIANWGISNLDNAVVGHAFGPTSLGLYSRSFTLASAPCDGIVGTVQQVLFTSCSRAEGRIEPIRKAYMASLSAVATFVFASFWAMAVCAPTVTVGLYGEKWRPAAVLFRPLAIAVSISAVMSISGPILAALDQVKREIHAQSLSLLVALVCFALTSRYSPAVLSWGVCGVYVFRFLVVTRPTKQLLQLRWRDIFGVLAGPAAAAAVTALVLYVLDSLAQQAGLRALPILFILCVSGCIVLPFLIVLFGSSILDPSLVGFLRVGLSGMPKSVGNLLERIERRQEDHHMAGLKIKTMGNSYVPIFIAATMRKQGNTGVHAHFQTLSAYWDSRGTPVEILTPYESPALLRRAVGLGMRGLLLFNVELAWFFKDVFYTKLLWLRMRKMLPRNGPWVVYAQCPVASLVAGKLRTRNDQSIVLVTHFNKSHADENVESGLASQNGRFYRWVQRNEHAGLLGADRIVYVSEFMRNHLITAVEGLSSRPSVVLPNFVSKPSPGGEEYGGDLVSIGTLEPRKNQSFLLEVLAAAKRKGKRYTLTLFGTGKPEQEWRQLAADLGVRDQVTFAGYVPQASRWLHRFRAYVHAARIENMPVSLIEALACGLPVIAARVGGIPEIISEGTNGFFWDLDNPESAADTIIGLLENAILLDSTRAAALDIYADKFGTDRIAPLLTHFIMYGSVCETNTKLDVIGGPDFQELVGDRAIL